MSPSILADLDGLGEVGVAGGSDEEDWVALSRHLPLHRPPHPALTTFCTTRCSCCACPETKKARDDCFLLHGSNADSSSDSQDKCREIVAQHRACMRKLGFNV